MQNDSRARQCLTRVIAVAFIAGAWPCHAARSQDAVLVEYSGAELPATWRVEGYAFGTRTPVPQERQKAAKTTRNQRQYQRGVMTSPELVIEHDYLEVYCAGVCHPTLSTIRLVVDGRVVRSCTPTSERGSVHWFDLRALKGERATIEVRDDHFNGWIERVKIVATDRQPPANAEVITTAARWAPDRFEATIEGDYLLLPVGPRDGTPLQPVTIAIDGREKLAADFPLAFGEIPVAGYLPVYDVTGFQGRKLTVSYHSHTGSEAAKFLMQGTIPGREVTDHKPAFHVHCRIGQLNDPNGLFYLDGVYHLFHQYRYTIWAKSWAHYTSTDLMHWREKPTGLFPDPLGSMHSGSAAVDVMNTSGWQRGDVPPVIAAFTGSRGLGGGDKIQVQGIAYSTDGGRTFTKYEGNPVVGESQILAKGSDHARDPKIFWFSPTRGRDPHVKDGYWVMVLFEGQSHAIYTSANARDWARHGEVHGFHECPELFPLAVDGDPNDVRWIMYGADGAYHIGTFDGKRFTPQTPAKIRMHHGGRFYAAQTFNNTPIGADGQPRRIQVGWQADQISLATELTLRTTPLGLRVCILPVEEIANLYTRSVERDGLTLKPGDANPLADLRGGLYDIDLVADLSSAERLALDIRGRRVVVDVESSTLAIAKSKVKLQDVKMLSLRAVVDHLSTEIYAGEHGLFHIPIYGVQATDKLSIEVKGGEVVFKKLRVHELKSIWTA